MKIFVDRLLLVRPELNPSLNLTEKVETRPGISHRPDYKVDEYDWTTKGGLRAIEHLLRANGNIPEDEEVEFLFTA